MQLDINTEIIPLDQIHALYEAKISQAFIDRMKKTRNDLDVFDYLLVVEKGSEDNAQYQLVGNYDMFVFLRDHTDIKSAPCVIENPSNSKFAYLKVFRRVFPRGDTTFKENRLNLLDILAKLGVSESEIVSKSPLSLSKLRNEYQYHADIPKNSINRNTSIKTMNKIHSLPVNPDVKDFLYTCAGLSKNDPNRLTNEVLSVIMPIVKEEPKAQLLTSHQLINILKQAFSPKRIALDKLRDALRKVSPFKKTG